jgi:hypothetical protein
MSAQLSAQSPVQEIGKQDVPGFPGLASRLDNCYYTQINHNIGGLVKITRNSVSVLLVVLALIGVFSASTAAGDRLYAPDYLWRKNIAEKTNPIDVANTHLGIPYRDDGALDDRGYFTTFDRPDRLFDSPGLNCSGLVVSVSRFLFNKNWSLQDVTKDPQGNSGSGSDLGKDWDFGLDLILNLTEGRPRKILSPDGTEMPLDKLDGLNMRGFDLHDATAWRKVLAQMRPGHIYLGSISKPTRKNGYKVLHYHVALMLPDEKGGVWLYHATRRSNVHRMNVNTPRGLNRLMSQFRSNRSGPKNILIVESELPSLDATAQKEADKSTNSAPVSDPGKRGGDQASAQATNSGSPKTRDVATTERDSQASNHVAQNSEPQTGSPRTPPQKPEDPGLVIEHQSGKVYKSHPELVTHIPRFHGKQSDSLLFWFRNRDTTPRNLELLLKGPEGTTQFKGSIPASNKDLSVVFPRDFENASSFSVRKGRYLAEVKIDGEPWSANVFEIGVPREAKPTLVQVRVPRTVKSGKTFTVKVVALNRGAESDYGGITVSSPDPSGLRLVSAKPGHLYGRGSTVLSVMSDKIRTKVPMAELWINLWGENKTYDMNVRIRAGKPGTYPLYVRCTLRGVNVKSSVVLMDPPESDTIDQQGFPVKVYQITVQ